MITNNFRFQRDNWNSGSQIQIYQYTKIQIYKHSNPDFRFQRYNWNSGSNIQIYKKNKYTNMQILISDSTRTSHELQPILTFPESHPTSQLWQFQHQFLISICINTFKLFLQWEVERYCHCCEINLTGSFCHCGIGQNFYRTQVSLVRSMCLVVWNLTDVTGWWRYQLNTNW